MKLTGESSDGYHTFNELYEHRTALFAALGAVLNELEFAENRPARAWRSREHEAGGMPMFPGFFIAGINLVIHAGADRYQHGQLTYHVQEEYWGHFRSFATLPQAPPYDGHTSDDVVKRLWLIAGIR